MIPQISVLTGGPGSGKTTLLAALSERGVYTIPEAALQLIAELNEKFGVEGQRAWRTSNFAEFQLMLIERQLRLEEEIMQPATTVADRSLLDIVGFCRFKRLPPPSQLTNELLAKRYCAAYLLDPLPYFADRRDTGRLFSRDESLAISSCIETAYLEASIPVTHVPFMTVEERASFVMKHLLSPVAPPSPARSQCSITTRVDP